MIDEETKEVAALALRNAFWSQFSALCNAYIAASKGLTRNQTEMLGELTSIYWRDDKESIADTDLNLHAVVNKMRSFSCDTMLEALQSDQAQEIWLRGKKVMERRDGEWFFIE